MPCYPILIPLKKINVLFCFSMLLFLYFIATTFMLLMLWLFKEPIANTWLNQSEIPYLKLISIYFVFNAPTILNELILLLHNRSRTIIQYGLFIFIGQFIGIVVILSISAQIEWVLYFIIGLAIVKFLYTIFLLSKYSKFKIEGKQLKVFAAFSLPLCLHMLVGNGMEFVDGFLVTSHFEEKDFAILDMEPGNYHWLLFGLGH